MPQHLNYTEIYHQEWAEVWQLGRCIGTDDDLGRRPLARLFCIFMLFGGLAPGAWGAVYSLEPDVPISVEHLVLVPGEDADAEFLRAWQTLCPKLGARLRAGDGPGGLGVFREIACHLGGPQSPASEQARGWRLQVARRGDALDSEISFQGASVNSKESGFVVGRVSLPAVGGELLEDAVLLDLWALALLDVLPMAWVAPAPPSGEHGAVGASHEVNLDDPDAILPKALTLFTLHLEPKRHIWRAQVVGRAHRLDDGSRFRWVPAWRSDTSQTSAVVYGQRAGESRLPSIRARFRSRLAQLTEDGASMLSEATEDLRLRYGSLRDEVWHNAVQQLAAGFGGLRYGVELVDPQESTLPQRSLVSLLAEFRSGILTGLRVYWDYVPTVKKAFQDDTLEFGYYRLLLGYGFGYDLPPSIARMGPRRIELAPKLGIWNLGARLPVADAAGEVAFHDFRIQDALGFGFEVSAELGRIETSTLFRPMTRPWYARDLSLSAFGNSLSSKTSSQRFGLDAFWKGPRLGEQVGLSFILFGFYEAVEIGGQGFSVGTVTAYGGGGATVDW